MSDRHLMLHAPSLGRSLHLWAFGHYGPPVVVFPTAGGFAHEWPAQGMVDALRPLLDAGRLKLYCPESNVSDAWTRHDAHPRWKIEQHLAYERFVLDVLLPAVRADCHSPGARLAVAGCSLGAMYAAIFALKHPGQISTALCLSGRYLATEFTGGYTDDEVYFHNPLAFVPNLEGEALQRVRATHLRLVCGRGPYEDGCLEETTALAGWLDRKNIPHQLDLWGHDSAHEWPWWRRQVLHHFGSGFPGR